MKKEILNEIYRIKEVMGLIVEATNPIFSWIDDLFYTLAAKNNSFQDELKAAANIAERLAAENVISPSNLANRVGKNINAEEIIDTIKTNGKFRVKLSDGSVVERNLSDLIDEETLIDVLKKYANKSPESFRTIFRQIIQTDANYLPDGLGDTIESLVKNKKAFLEKGVEGKQKYKEYLDRLDELSTNSTMDKEMKDIVSDFVINEKSSIGITPSSDEIKEIVRKKFQNKTGKKDLPELVSFAGIQFKDGIKSNEIDDIVDEIMVMSEIKTAEDLSKAIDTKLEKLGFTDSRYKKISKNVIQQGCFNYLVKGETIEVLGLIGRIRGLDPKSKTIEKDQSKFKWGKCSVIPVILLGSAIVATTTYTWADIMSWGTPDLEDTGIYPSSQTVMKHFKDYQPDNYNKVNNLLQEVTFQEAVQGTVQSIRNNDKDEDENKDGKEQQTAQLTDVNKIVIRRGDDSYVIGYNQKLGETDYEKSENWYVVINDTKNMFPQLPANYWDVLSKLNEFCGWLRETNPTTKNDFTLSTYSADYSPDKGEYYVWTRNQPGSKVTYKEDNTDQTLKTEDDFKNIIIEKFKVWVTGEEGEQWGEPIDESIWDIKLTGNKIKVERKSDPGNEFYEYEPDGEENFKLTQQKTPQKR